MQLKPNDSLLLALVTQHLPVTIQKQIIEIKDLEYQSRQIGEDHMRLIEKLTNKNKLISTEDLPLPKALKDKILYGIKPMRVKADKSFTRLHNPTPIDKMVAAKSKQWSEKSFDECLSE